MRVESFHFLQQLERIRTQISEKQNEVSSGVRVSKPSDDPANAGIISGLNNTLGRIDRHEQRIAYVENLLATQDNIVANGVNLLTRARELATQAANEALGTEEREALGEEVFALRDSMVQLANSTIYGRYIYAGGADDSPAFALDADTYTEPGTTIPLTGENTIATERWTFAPTDNSVTGVDEGGVLRTVNITDDLQVRVTSRGDDVWERSITALEQLGRTLFGFRSDQFDEPAPPGTGNPIPGTGDPYDFANGEFDQQTADIRSQLDTITTAMNEDLIRERTNLGSRLSRVELAKSVLERVKTDTLEARSIHRDTDVFGAASDLTNLQQTLEATLQVGATFNRLSLLDFL
ncbi:MAG: hypothetical protein KDD44_06920 [Bdellovibrionales bacterium]|nr:hypothetical protein [Bdellovibrionales bacterium]